MNRPVNEDIDDVLTRLDELYLLRKNRFPIIPKRPIWMDKFQNVQLKFYFSKLSNETIYI